MWCGDFTIFQVQSCSNVHAYGQNINAIKFRNLCKFTHLTMISVHQLDWGKSFHKWVSGVSECEFASGFAINDARERLWGARVWGGIDAAEKWSENSCFGGGLMVAASNYYAIAPGPWMCSVIDNPISRVRRVSCKPSCFYRSFSKTVASMCWLWCTIDGSCTYCTV